VLGEVSDTAAIDVGCLTPLRATDACVPRKGVRHLCELVARPRVWGRAGPKKIHRAGGAFVHLPREPSASAYGPRERLRPTRAPCSVQGRTYGLRRRRARAPRAGTAQFADSSSSTARDSDSCCMLQKEADHKNSPSRWRFRPPPPGTFGFRLLALGNGFDLLALRARCKREPTPTARSDQGRSRANSVHFAHRALSTFPRFFQGVGEKSVDRRPAANPDVRGGRKQASTVASSSFP
jgi:hypothetical protein